MFDVTFDPTSEFALDQMVDPTSEFALDQMDGGSITEVDLNPLEMDRGSITDNGNPEAFYMRRPGGIPPGTPDRIPTEAELAIIFLTGATLGFLLGWILPPP